MKLSKTVPIVAAFAVVMAFARASEAEDDDEPLPAPTAAPVAAPFHAPFQASMALDVIWRPDRGYDVFTDAQVSAGFGLTFARTFTARGSRIEFGAEVGWRLDGVAGRFAQRFNSALWTNTFTGGVHVRLAVAPFFLPFVRVAGGGAITETRLTADDSSGALVGNAWSAVGIAGLGVMLRTPNGFAREGVGSRVGFAFSVEGGAQLFSTTTLVVTPEAPRDDRVAREQIPLRSATLGDVQQSAPYMRMAAGFVF